MSGGQIHVNGLEETAVPQPEGYGDHRSIRDLKHYDELWRQSIDDNEGYWGRVAAECVDFQVPWTRVLDWQAPRADWFPGGKLNVAVNCLDRHLHDFSTKPALIWEGEPGDSRFLSYADLHAEVCRFANVLSGLGITAGDRVTVYMPLIPECVVAMLACARIGATHNVVFAGFSAEALAERNLDCGARLVITADGVFRKGEKVALKAQVDAALRQANQVEHVIVCRRTDQATSMTAGRDLWWHELMAGAGAEHEAQAFDASHPLFILYTSGSTGKPKGILHGSAGYLVGVTSSFRQVFDLRPQDTYWCTADVGWVTGHSYVVYGPLANAATLFIYEGALLHPSYDRVWSLVDRYQVNILYTAPTAIRSFMQLGRKWPEYHDLGSLRLLGTVGEPINPAAWHWYFEVIGKRRCPVVDTWWQTETGAIMISPLPGVTPMIPGSATRPLFGIDPDVVDEHGRSVPEGSGGYLVIRKPWPSMLMSIHNDHERYEKQYWSRFPGMYFTGDGARRDESGNIFILGRVDDVINVAGHRLSTMEIESALVSHAAVAEAACVGYPDELTGEAIHGFVTLEEGRVGDVDLTAQLQSHVSLKIGKLARPKLITYCKSLPKTRSGKIMRRLLKDIAAKREVRGDTSTLEDFNVLAKIQESQIEQSAPFK